MALALNDFASVSISAATVSPTVPGFGKTLALVNKVPVSFPATPQTYTSTTQLIAAGFATTDDAYLMLSAAFSQNPAPTSVMIYARTLKTTQVIKLACLVATQGTVYAITLVTPAGVATPITYTVPAAQTTTQVATAILALINAVTGFSGSTSSTNTITVASPAAGTLNAFNNWTSNFYLTDTTADPGIATDLAGAIAIDNTWYGVAIDSQSKAEIVAAAAFCETNKKLFVTQSAESTVPDNSVSTDVASTVQSSAYHYTAILYSGQNTKAYAGLAWESLRFAASPVPGNDTWMYNTLSGVTVDPLTETQSATLANKNATGYAQVQGVNVTASGNIANSNSGGKSGSGEFIDVRRFDDWQVAQIQLAIYACFLGPNKTPYTDKGIAKVGTAIGSALLRGEQAGGIVAGTSQVNVPTAANAGTSDRGARILRNANWGYQLTGAVHLVQSTGAVTQ